jgi:lanosterol synthase
LFEHSPFLFTPKMIVASENYRTAALNLSSTPKFTDLNNWRLKVVEGAQTWHYLETDEERKAWPQTLWDKYSLGLPIVNKLSFECIYDHSN